MNQTKSQHSVTLLLTLILLLGGLSLLTTAGCRKQGEDSAKAGDSAYYTGPMKSKSTVDSKPAKSPGAEAD